ncbi:MAG: 3-hydroxyacyl-CoA dehydrogenase NAD-binding domain-containing protein [Alphaproteobacteria bacterium]|nr:3-hydroxyacyl-CoA dehydrogenase NAD-binding domain-containing protein [Alphaproteobacteria bacterium]
MSSGRIAVVGTGLIGSGWVLHFLRLGFEVQAYDPADGSEARLAETIRVNWPLLERLGLAGGASPGRLVCHGALADAVHESSVVLECAPERLDVKQALFSDMDGMAAPDALLFSCSSSFTISDIRARAARPERCLLGHPFNPPHILPLVEVAGGARDSEPVRRAMAFWESVGKVPVHLRRELPGHLVNRLTAALFREAVYLVAEDVADVEDIDRAVAFGPGPRLALAGPFLNYHLGGGAGGIEHYFEHLGPSQVARWKTLGAPELTDAVVARIVDGVRRMTVGRSVEELAADRDEALLRLAKMLRWKA